MTLTDPPYNVDYASSPKDKLRGKHRPILNDNLGGGFEGFLQHACSNILAVTKGAVYVCMSSSELHTLQKAFTAAGGKWSTFVIWPNTPSPSAAPTTSASTSRFPAAGGTVTITTGAGAGSRRRLVFDKPVRNDLHPTMKPVALVERAIRNSSKSRDIVLDPFGGSGSTLIACEKSERQARLVELDPKYCDVMVRRWQEWTGEQATLDGDGRSFEEIAAGRLAAAA